MQATYVFPGYWNHMVYLVLNTCFFSKPDRFEVHFAYLPAMLRS